MKYTFNSTTYALINAVGEEVWVQGDNNTKVVKFFFADTEPLTDYECRAVIKRANGEISNELYCSPINTGSEKYYKLSIKGWMTDFSGTVEITVRRKKFNIVTNEYDVISYGLITKDVSAGVLPETSNTITEEQYLLLLSQISALQPHLVTNLGYVTDFDDVIVSGVYQFYFGLLIVNTVDDYTYQYKIELKEEQDQSPSINLFNNMVEHRILYQGIWSEWNNELGVDSIVANKGEFENAIINEELSVNNVVATHIETETISILDKIIGNLKIGQDLEVERHFVVKQNTELRGNVSVGGNTSFEQIPSTSDDPTLSTHLTTKAYVDNAFNSVNNDVVEIIDGTIIVKKTERDAQNNVIHTHYATKNELEEHNENENSHLFLRQSDENLQEQIDRINGRGLSKGVVDYLQSELVAMSESDRNLAINDDILSRFPFYTPTSGDLTYTKDSTLENTHEWEFSSTTWVDNGAYTTQKASNTNYGIVKGNGDYINIVLGIIEVLKSNYATRVGTDLSNSYTYNQLNTLITTLESEVANRYTKNQVYTKLEVDSIINLLKTEHGWQEDVIWDKESLVEDQIKSLDLSLIEQYDYVIISKFSHEFFLLQRSDTVRVSDIVDLPNDSTLIFYEDGENIKRFTSPSALDFENATTMEVDFSVFGLKMMPLTADKVIYDGGTVEEALDNINQDITDIEENIEEIKRDNIETNIHLTSLEETIRKSMSNDVQNNIKGVSVIPLGKDVANAPLQFELKGATIYSKQLIPNADFSNGLTGWMGNVSSNSISGGILTNTGNGVGAQPALYTASQPAVAGNKYYVSCRYKVNTNKVQSVRHFDGTSTRTLRTSPVQNQWYVDSDVFLQTVTYYEHIYHVYATSGDANGSSIDVKFVYLYDITQMQSLKTYSPMYDTTFDLLTDEQIKIQMDYLVTGGKLPNSNELTINFNKRITSIGINLFNRDSSKNIFGYEMDQNGNLTAQPNWLVTHFIPVRSNTTYSRIYFGQSAVFYDSNLNFISGFSSTVTTFTTPMGTSYMRLNAQIPSINIVQVVEGSIMPAYQPYKSTELYLQPNVKGYGVPTIQDKIVYRNGKYYLQKNVTSRKYTGVENWLHLSANDNDTTMLFYIDVTGRVPATNNFCSNMYPVTNIVTAINVIEGMWGNNSNTVIYVRVLKSKLPTQDLAGFKTFLNTNNLMLSYQTSFIETEILSSGIPLGFENGTVILEDIIADVDIYTDKASITNTNYLIKALDSVVKLNTDGSQTYLNVASAVISGDKLSFTHPNLTSNDALAFSYLYESTNSIEGNTTVYFYDNKFVVVDTANSKVYKWKVVSTNGVGSLAMEEV